MEQTKYKTNKLSLVGLQSDEFFHKLQFANGYHAAVQQQQQQQQNDIATSSSTLVGAEGQNNNNSTETNAAHDSNGPNITSSSPNTEQEQQQQEQKQEQEKQESPNISPRPSIHSNNLKTPEDRLKNLFKVLSSYNALPPNFNELFQDFRQSVKVYMQPLDEMILPEAEKCCFFLMNSGKESKRKSTKRKNRKKKEKEKEMTIESATCILRSLVFSSNAMRCLSIFLFFHIPYI
jgi:hypothetical protein